MTRFKTVRLLCRLFSITAKSINVVTKRYVTDFYKDRLKRMLSFSIRKRMTLSEANKILGLDANLRYSENDIHNITKRMLELNEMNGKYRGSPYIQEKIMIAERLVMEKLVKNTKFN